EDHHAHGGVGVQPVTEIVQTLVHLEGHRVARLGAIDGDERDALLPLEGEMAGDGLDHGANDSASAPAPATLGAMIWPTRARARDVVVAGPPAQGLPHAGRLPRASG